MKITPEHFEIFKKECQKWIEIFGLKNWQINYVHKKLEKARARTSFNCVGGIATIFLNTNWDEDATYYFDVNDIRKSAFHEVCELLLGRLNNMVEQRYALHGEDAEEEVHRIIRILENVLWK